MSIAGLSEDTKKYLSMFYKPEITSYEFLKCFFAELFKRGKKDVSRDLIEFFYDIKKDPKYHELLREIKFKSNGIFRYSNELEDDIFTLQNMGLLGKENPSFGIILIKYNDAIAEESLNAISDQHLQLISEIANQYLSENADAIKCGCCIK